MRFTINTTGLTFTVPAVEEVIPLTAAMVKDHDPKSGRVRPLIDSDPLRTQGFVSLFVKPARERAVRLIGSAIVGTAGSIRKAKGVTISAADAAHLALLTPEETALFVSRFPTDGTMPRTPKDAAAVEAVGKKVLTALVGKSLTFGADTPERNLLAL